MGFRDSGEGGGKGGVGYDVQLDGGEVFSWAAGGDEGGERVRAFSFGVGAEDYVIVGFEGGCEDAGCDEAETLVRSWAYG